MKIGFRLDMLVNDKVIVEIKSIEQLMNVHHKQLLTYHKLSDKKPGQLNNFNETSLTNSITQIVNNL